jgi:hypothetical protein
MAITWIPARVGCHWFSEDGNYTISTWLCGTESGYKLLRNRDEIGSYPTLAEAKDAAEGWAA